MKKIALILLFVFSISHAGLVNGIAIIVNDEPITLYDVDVEMQTQGVDKKTAVANLIDSVIYQQQVDKNNIKVDIFDVDNYIGQLAAKNKMETTQFKSLLRQKRDYDKFIESVKLQITHEKLIKSLAVGKITIATEDDIKRYYENNKDQYEVANEIVVKAYVSKSKIALEKISKSPMMDDKRVKTQDNITFNYNEVNPQVRFILQGTKVNSFSPIFVQGENYNMFFVKNKVGVKTLPLEEVKNRIFQTIMEQRENNFLNEYFETQKITANIKVFR